MNAPHYLTDAEGNRTAVVLDLETYRAMLEAREDAADRDFARDYEAREATGLLTPDELDVMPLDRVIAEIEAVWAARLDSGYTQGVAA